jgi:4-hydroxy-3-methylbut-2-en-1-yl diphosphate reductase
VEGDPVSELLLLAPLRIEARALRRGGNNSAVVATGAGRRRSEAAAARLAVTIAGHRAAAVAGFCGAVDPDLQPGDIVVASTVIDPDGRRRDFPGAAMLAGELGRAGLRAVCGPVRSTERLVRGHGRAELRATGSVAADMESAWLIDGIPATVSTAVVRAVTDGPRHELVSPRAPINAWRAARSLRAAVPVLERWAAAVRPRRVLLAAPRGFCAGVERAIEVVERALDRFGPPIYVRRHIIHNTHVVADLAARGAIFVEELDEVPDGCRVVFAAHGIAPAVRDDADRRGLATIDATCPLVAKVHSEVRRFASKDYRVLLIGHPDHEEVQGTIGEAPGSVVVIEDAPAADEVVVPDRDRVAFVTQTTLAVDEVAEIIGRLQERFPAIEGPARDDICYATQNRQDAARALAPECDVVLVVGSPTSSNSNRLVEVVRRDGCPAHLVDDDSGLELPWIAAAGTVGVTAGASAPEDMVQRVIAALGSLGPVEVIEQSGLVEDVHFTLPAEVR